MSGDEPASARAGARGTPRLAFLAILFALLWTSLAGSAHADVLVDDALGHNGRWVIGAATPYEVTLHNNGNKAVEVTLSVDTKSLLGGGQGLRHVRSVVVGPGATRREPFLLSGPPVTAKRRLVVQVAPVVPIHYGDKSATRGRMEITAESDMGLGSRAIHAPRRILGTLGDTRGALRAALALHTEADYDEYAALEMREGFVDMAGLEIAPRSLELLPFGLDGVDTLVVLDPDASFAGDPKVLDGLLDWVALGGRLVISLGDDSAAFRASPLAPVLPASWGNAESSEYMGVVKALLGEEEGPQRVASGPWSRLTPRDDIASIRVRRRLDGAAYGVSRPYGNGSIEVVAFELATFSRGLQHPELARRVVDWLLPPQVEPPTPQALASLGMTRDLAPFDTVRRRLQQGAVEPPPIGLVIIALCLYVLVVGPVDWLVLRKLGKQRLTTLTFTASVVGFTAIAYLVSLLIFAQDAVTNRVVIVDLAQVPETGREVARVMDVGAYYEPVGGTREVRYALPAYFPSSDFPGSYEAADSGRSSDVQVGGPDPLGPVGRVDIAFRSQATVRGMLAGSLPRTVEVEVESGRPRLLNGFEDTIESALLVRVVGTSVEWVEIRNVPGGNEAPFGGWSRGPLPTMSHQTLEDLDSTLLSLTLAAIEERADPNTYSRRHTRSALAGYRDAGFDLSHLLAPPVPPYRVATTLPSRALLIARLSAAPLALPGAEVEGEQHVIVRKLVELE